MFPTIRAHVYVDPAADKMKSGGYRNETVIVSPQDDWFLMPVMPAM